MKVTIHTDGACSGNPGRGGWAALLSAAHKERLISGNESVTTNNRMELTAAIMALETLTRSCEVHLYTDSSYVQKGITQWLPTWMANNWRTKDKKEVKNQDLWQRLHAASQKHDVHWHWVKGHAGNERNERVDAAARTALLQACQ